MDDWKKVYSNNDTKTVAMPYFWKNFDKENYSIWYSEYKYPEDLKMVFMSCNLISGKKIKKYKLYFHFDKDDQILFLSSCLYK